MKQYKRWGCAVLASAPLVAGLGSQPAFAQDEMDHSQHQNHAAMSASSGDETEPAHVHHHHGAGMWMFEYRYMSMYQEGMLYGSKSIAPADVFNFADYVDENGDPEDTVGTDMTMDMHMFMVMYQATERLGFMVMANYLDNEMNMLMRPGMPDMPGMDPMDSMETMYMQSSGVGDTQVAAMYNLDNYLLFNPVLTLQLNVPTGSITEVDEMGERLPYDMQLGTGSWDLQPTLTMSEKMDAFGLGGEISYLYHMCDNEENYRWGDKFRVQGWAKYTLPFGTTLRASVTHQNWEAIQGRDENINTNTDYYGGMRTDVGFALSQELPYNFNVAFEYQMPVHQKLDGYQMETDYIWNVAVQWMI